MLPNVNAVEYNEIKDNIESKLDNINNIFEKLGSYSSFFLLLFYYYIFCFILTFNYLVTCSLYPWSGSDPLPPFKAFVASFFFVIITMLVIPFQILISLGFEGPIIIKLFYIVILIFDFILFIMENLIQLFEWNENFEKNHFRFNI
jgi:hypothetical protein